MSRRMTPIPGRKTHHYLYGNPYLFYLLLGVLRAAMPSSTAAAAAAFLEFGKRSLLPSSDVLRGFFDATLDRGKPASALKGKCKTCQHYVLTQYFVRTNVKNNVLLLLLVRV